MATGDRVVTPWQRQHEMIEAAQERGWYVIRFDERSGITLEEPGSHGMILNITGVNLSPAFLRSLPEARQLSPRVDPETLPGPLEPRFSRADPNRAAS